MSSLSLAFLPSFYNLLPLVQFQALNKVHTLHSCVWLGYDLICIYVL
jgi:hypothetical protein